LSGQILGWPDNLSGRLPLSRKFKIFKGSTLLAFVNKKGKRQNEILPDQKVVVKFPVVANFRFVIHQAVTAN